MFFNSILPQDTHAFTPQILCVYSVIFRPSTIPDRAHRHLWKTKQNQSVNEKKKYYYPLAVHTYQQQKLNMGL